MLVVMVRMPLASSEQSEQMVNRFRNRAGLVDGQPGFLGFELLQAEDELISMTRWASREDLDRWMASQSHAQAHSNVPEANQTGSGQPQRGGPVTIYEVVIPREQG
ncbi:MAG TPA: antibiotic biosynthesis monooxygenase [Chloroflexia bacterium]|nr:antibiotic biosynthesis monooxygenase [Chloroflexia bacterium]